MIYNILKITKQCNDSYMLSEHFFLSHEPVKALSLNITNVSNQNSFTFFISNYSHGIYYVHSTPFNKPLSIRLINISLRLTSVTDLKHCLGKSSKTWFKMKILQGCGYSMHKSNIPYTVQRVSCTGRVLRTNSYTQVNLWVGTTYYCNFQRNIHDETFKVMYEKGVL